MRSFNRVNIAREIPVNNKSYGYIHESEVPELLKPYIDNGLVHVAKIRHRTSGGEHVGYRTNMELRDDISRELDLPYSSTRK